LSALISLKRKQKAKDFFLDHGFYEDDVIAENMIPTSFNDDTEFLSDSNLSSLKYHYMTFYLKESKDFLDYIEVLMSHDSKLDLKSVLDPRRVFLTLVRFLP
jgi:hypothetical protein